KGWSASPSAGLVVMGPRAEARLAETTSDSFALDLKKWRSIMAAYEGGGHAYHATMPTDALARLRDVMLEADGIGMEKLKVAQQELGRKVRAMLAAQGYKSVAAPGFEAPGVVVSYTDDPELQSGKKALAQGLQIAAGVPLECDEGADFRTFRVGLFGLDKLLDIDRTVASLESGLRAAA
ncbi:MAG TPA: alanine--glyoxylate aminotransferase family protein, partial [Rhodocyclaceae bacterium]|nr:alanine--glyoxylate aminotransferase family protein [Rhodocyclaceae bacterium]